MKYFWLKFENEEESDYFINYSRNCTISINFINAYIYCVTLVIELKGKKKKDILTRFIFDDANLLFDQFLKQFQLIFISYKHNWRVQKWTHINSLPKFLDKNIYKLTTDQNLIKLNVKKNIRNVRTL